MHADTQNTTDMPKIYVNETSIPKILHSLSLAPFMDSLRILIYKAKVMTKSEEGKCKQTLAMYLEFLTRNKHGFAHASNNHAKGAEWEVKVASLSLFLDDILDYLKISHRGKLYVEAYHMHLVQKCNNSTIDIKIPLVDCELNSVEEIARELELIEKLVIYSRISKNAFESSKKHLGELAVDLWKWKSKHRMSFNATLAELVPLRVKLIDRVCTDSKP